MKPTLIALALALCGCVTVPVNGGKATVYFPMEANFDTQGRVTTIGPNIRATEIMTSGVLAASPVLIEAGAKVLQEQRKSE